MKVPYQLLRAARVALDIEHKDLAKEAGVSKRTLVRIERPERVSADSIVRVQAALERLGIEFLLPEDGRGPGIRISEQAFREPKFRRHERGQKDECPTR